MGWYYSCGIVFSDYKIAELCGEDFKNKKIVLSDNDCVKILPDIIKHEENDFLEKKLFILRIFIDGLGTTDTNLKLYENPYFSEIRDFFYNYLKKLNYQFEFAHYELEAADVLSISEPLEGIAYSLEKKSKSFEKNSDNSQKRFIDGMVVSLNNLKKWDSFKDEFEYFKEGYYWIPLKEFKISK